MQKLVCLLCVVALLACNNQSATTDNKDTATTSATTNVVMNADALSFLAPCVDNAKTRLSEQEAYALCKCVYAQVQQQHPNEDSTTLLQHLSDTAEVARMAANCK
jgi:hypothetical protein